MEDKSVFVKQSEEVVDKSRFSKNSIFLFCVAGVASVIGFTTTYMLSKRAEIEQLTSQDTSLKVREQMENMRRGTRLAARAFGISWVYSICGVSAFSWCVWRLSGASSFEDFKLRVAAILPPISKSEPQGRNDFKSLRELADYLVKEDEVRVKDNQVKVSPGRD